MGMNDGYPISVPIMNCIVDGETRQATLDEIRKSGAFRVWIADGQNVLFYGKESKTYQLLKENVEFFKAAGYEVGVWINSYGFGGPVPAAIAEKTKNWTRITALRQQEEPKDNAAFCPEDPEFTAEFCRQIRDIAELKPDLIMLDDDLCFSVRPGVGCFCDRHMKLLEEKTKQPLKDKNRLAQLMFTTGRNLFRDSWLSVMKKSHINFCTKVREALDSVDPTIRMGFCAGYTSWDIEGADAITLTHILAGNTKPFLRFTSAPYWVSTGRNRFPGMKMNMIIEHARQQEVWCRESGIEVFNENDSYPRPRYHVPANLCESFDLATRASGGMGSLKYLIDYHSSPEYETGYMKHHLRNAPMARWIEEHFTDKTADGVQIYRPMRTIKEAKLPPVYGNDYAAEKDIMRRVFAPEIWLLTQLSIPVRHDLSDTVPAYGIAFGDDINYVPEGRMPKYMIIDLPAARDLIRSEVDVGLESFEPAPDQAKEVFERSGRKPLEMVMTYSKVFRPAYLGSGIYSGKVAPGAQIQSWFEDGEGIRIPASYTYDNGTTKFLVLLADVDTLGQSSTFCSSYARQQQLLNFLGRPYPAIENEPDIYTLYKRTEDGSEAAVLFQNLGQDMLFDFDIRLNRPCQSVECCGAEGTLSEDGMRFHINTDVAPWSSLALHLRYKD